MQTFTKHTHMYVVRNTTEVKMLTVTRWPALVGAIVRENCVSGRDKFHALIVSLPLV